VQLSDLFSVEVPKWKIIANIYVCEASTFEESEVIIGLIIVIGCSTLESISSEYLEFNIRMGVEICLVQYILCVTVS
jgi:hypothetical protein